jgi:hypothetical protein
MPVKQLQMCFGLPNEFLRPGFGSRGLQTWMVKVQKTAFDPHETIVHLCRVHLHRYVKVLSDALTSLKMVRCMFNTLADSAAGEAMDLG